MAWKWQSRLGYVAGNRWTHVPDEDITKLTWSLVWKSWRSPQGPPFWGSIPAGIPLGFREPRTKTSHCVAAPTFEDGKHGHTVGLSLRGSGLWIFGTPQRPQNIIKTYQNPDQRWSISVQNASLAPPGYYCLGVFFPHFVASKGFGTRKFSKGSPRNPLRTTSRAKEPEEDLTEDKSPDQEPPEAWGRPSCGARFFLNMSDLHPIHSKIDGEKDHKPWDFWVTWFLDSRQSPKKN